MTPVRTMSRPNRTPSAILTSGITFTIGVMCALFFLQDHDAGEVAKLAAPVAQMPIAQPVQSEVTRAATQALLTVATPAQEATADPEADLIALSAKVTPDAGTLDLTTLATALTDGIIVDPNFDPRTATREETIAVANAGVADIAGGILAGDYTVTARQEADQPARITLTVANRETTSSSLEALLSRAVESGDIALPEAYAANDGKVDPQTLLFDLVQRSLENGSPEEVAAAAELRRRAAQAAAAPSEVVDSVRYYTVTAGDSLAYISLQFYGTAKAYDRIFEANRSLISEPDLIQIGQRLVIPNT